MAYLGRTQVIDENGNLINDERPFPVELQGNNGSKSQFGEVLTSSRTPVIELNSSYGTSALRDLEAVTGSATITAANGEIILSTGATATSAADLRSLEVGRYIPGYAAQIGNGARVPTPPTGNQYAEWGGISSNGGDDAILWGVDATGVYVKRSRNGVTETKVYQSSWNIDVVDGLNGVNNPSGVALNLADGNIFQIDFTWYGYGQILWGLITNIGDTQTFVPVHREKVTGTTSITSPNLRTYAISDNGGDASNFDLYIGGRQYSIVGQYIPDFRFVAEYRGVVTATTSPTPLITFKGKTGFLDRSVLMDAITVLVANNPIILEVYLDGTLTGASFGTPTNYTASETALEVDISATAITGGTLFWSEYFLNGATPSRPQLSQEFLDVDINSQAPVTLCARGIGGSANVSTFFRMKEEW